MKKSSISNFIRKMGLIRIADKVRYILMKYKNKKINASFKMRFPDVNLPDDYTIYESFALDYEKYYIEGKDTAKKYVKIFKRHVDLKGKRLLEWGCGPARIIRHFSELMSDKNLKIVGTDYNAKTVDWCNSNIYGVAFDKNDLTPPLLYKDKSFDIILANSVFTHLSEEQHHKWVNELFRVLDKNGILVFTTHGDATKVKLSMEEVEKYENGQMIERGDTREGHRTFTAFHPIVFVEELVKGFTVLEHVKGIIIAGVPTQDCWIVRKVD